MLVSVVKVGNSRGIRLPKGILDQLDITDSVELEVVDRSIVLRPVKSVPRTGWDRAFSDMARLGEDSPLVDNAAAGDDFEWEW